MLMPSTLPAASTELKPGRPSILFLNRSYWPCGEATGQLLTELCEDLVRDFDVSVIAGQPNQNPGGFAFRAVGTQHRRGVAIHRVNHARLPKARLWGRAVNLLSYLAAATQATLSTRRHDVVIVETDPPLLALLGAALQRLHRCGLIVYLQDIYPDLAVALGKVPNNLAIRWLRKVLFAIYRRADQVVVLSRDMEDFLLEAGIPADRITCVPNWIDTKVVCPSKHENPFRAAQGLGDRFVVMYSGNMGMCQPLEPLLQAAERLRNDERIVFCLVGDGVAKRPLMARAQAANLRNVRFFGYQPKHGLAHSLSAADLQVVAVDPRVARFLMPSKLYGILASATPVLALAPAGTELERLVRQEAVGFAHDPDDVDAIVETIRWSVNHPGDLRAMGNRARALATREFDRKRVTMKFAEVVKRVLLARQTVPRMEKESKLGQAKLAARLLPKSSSWTRRHRQQTERSASLESRS